MALIDEFRKSRQASWQGFLSALLGIMGLASLVISPALLLLGFSNLERKGGAAIAGGLFAVAAATCFGFLLVYRARK